ncbi:MAG: glycosyltransferase [bacterium]|nr:glycosyltransferase [bacterium]
MPTKRLRVALVKDWLTSYGGSEEQLWQLHLLYPDAPIYTSVYDEQRLPQFKKATIKEMSLSGWFRKGRRFEKLALILPLYFSTLHLSDYDLVISITSGFAKAVTTNSQTVHLCICNTPIRFAWGFGTDKRGLLGSILAPLFRWFDKRSAQKVDYFLANSVNVARRIKQVYQRDSEVLYPPVHVENFIDLKRSRQPEGLITIGRLVYYKRIDLIIAACNQLQLPLTVIGTGPEESRLQKLAGPTVKLLGFCDTAKIKQELTKAKAFVFAAEEDFGIAPVEAMAAGCPVIALKKGGSLETVTSKTGTFFNEQTVDSLVEAIQHLPADWDIVSMRKQANKFSVEKFITGVTSFIDRFTR